MRKEITQFRWLAGAAALLALSAAGCNGSSTTAPLLTGGATPTPSPSSLPASATATIAVGAAAAASVSLGPVLGGYSSTITVPHASTPATLTVNLAAMQPAGTPAVQTVKRRAQTIGGTGIAPVAFVTITSNATVTFGATPTFAFTLPSGAASLGQVSYLALYDPSATPQPGWITFAGPGTVSGNTIAFSGTIGNQQLTSGVTYNIVLFTAANALPTPSPSPSASPVPTATPAPTATPVASAQHLYTLTGGVTEFALPITSNSTPIVTVPLTLTASDSQFGPSLAVNAAHVIYTDTVHDAYFVLNQPISSTSTPSATFCQPGCPTDHQFSPSVMRVALSPFDFLAATDSGAGGPVPGSFVSFFNSPFTNQTTPNASRLSLPNAGAGLAYDAAGNLYAGGSSTPSGGDVEEYGGNILLAHVKTTIFITSVAVNANVLAVAGSTGSPCVGEVLIYTLPFTSSSVPSATITNGLGNTCGYFVALDSAGNLYVNGTPQGLSVYAPPLSNSSSPSVNLALGNGFTQIVIGP